MLMRIGMRYRSEKDKYEEDVVVRDDDDDDDDGDDDGSSWPTCAGVPGKLHRTVAAYLPDVTPPNTRASIITVRGVQARTQLAGI